jgi:hypothetical protein
MVQLAGHDLLKANGIALIAASAPTFFIEETRRPPFWCARSLAPQRSSRRRPLSRSWQRRGNESG